MRTGSIFSSLAAVFWAAALLVGYGAATMEIGVASEYGGGYVANLQMLQIQMVGFMLAIGSAIIGTLFIGFAAIVPDKAAASARSALEDGAF